MGARVTVRPMTVTAPAGAAIRLENLTVGYDRHPAVHHLTGVFEGGSMTAVVGPNGAGKTTLLRAIMGLLPSEGGLAVEGARHRDIAYLPQQSELDMGFPISVREVVALGLWRRAGAFRAMGAGADVDRAIQAVGLEGFEGRPIATLSAGQLQRALFARVLVQDAPVVLLDEPFAAIDTRTTSHLLSLMERWNAERRTVVCVLHDLDLARRHFPHALLLAREAIAWGPTGEALAPANLLRARAMAENWDEDAAMCARSA
jgi:zinc/manganese transport system ATP-binding protein